MREAGHVVSARYDRGRSRVVVALNTGVELAFPTRLNPQLTLKALSFFGDSNLDRLPRDLQDRLAQAARDVDLDRLPAIADLVRSFEQDSRNKP